jgi:hypothetical protein
VREGHALKTSDFSVIFGCRLGSAARRLNSAATVFLFVSVLTAYHGLLINTLSELLGATSCVSTWAIAAGVVALALPLASMRDQSKVNKAASVGFLWILYVTVFVCVKCMAAILADGARFQAVDAAGVTGAFPGILVGIYSPHAYVLTIASQKRERCTDERDVRTAFAVVTGLVLLLGTLSSSAFETAGMSQNFVLAFPESDRYAVTAKCATVLAVLGSFLSILNVLRFTIFNYLKPGQDAVAAIPRSATIGFNAAVVVFTCVAAVLCPQAGEILGLGCAGAAVLQVFGFPAAVYISRLKWSCRAATRVHVASATHVGVMALGVVCLTCAIRAFLVVIHVIQ